MSCKPPAGGPAMLGCCGGTTEDSLLVRGARVWMDFFYYIPGLPEYYDKLVTELESASLATTANFYNNTMIYYFGDGTEKSRTVEEVGFPYVPGSGDPMQMDARYPFYDIGSGRAIGWKYVIDNTDLTCREIYSYYPTTRTECKKVQGGVEYTIAISATTTRLQHQLWGPLDPGLPDCCNEAP